MMLLYSLPVNFYSLRNILLVMLYASKFDFTFENISLYFIQ